MQQWPIILFLDIDGVLNTHKYMEEAGSFPIHPACIRQLNRVLQATGARIVLSSAWRRMIHGRAMTLKGFHYLLRSHGLIVGNRQDGCLLVDVTCRDEDIPDRRDQVLAWLHSHPEVERFAVVDDIDFGFVAAGLPFVQTDRNTGLTQADADRLIFWLQPNDGTAHSKIETSTIPVK